MNLYTSHLISCDNKDNKDVILVVINKIIKKMWICIPHLISCDNKDDKDVILVVMNKTFIVMNKIIRWMWQ